MKKFNEQHSIRQIPNWNQQTWSANSTDKSLYLNSEDTLVLFGELFQRGYANGLVEEAEKRNMTIVRSTVGRRNKEGQLVSLNNEEIETIPKPFINIPLEAGFDLESDDSGLSVVDKLKDVKLSEWENFKIDKSWVENIIQHSRKRFRTQVKNYISELRKILPNKGHIYIAHLMAGGVPRAKVIMPLMNRSFKGTGDRYLSSQKFWESDIGWICQKSFFEVTAETFNILIEETRDLDTYLKSQGRKLCFSAYGYHGTEIYCNNQMQWQTYTPYLQGFAKILLENYSKKWHEQGVLCCVYNCPEILTNSSSIFSGVEVSLYPLLGLLLKESKANPSANIQIILDNCKKLLKEEYTINEILQFCDQYLKKQIIQEHNVFEKWPQHSSPEQLKIMLDSSEHLFNMHKDTKFLITGVLSELVLKSCGFIMFQDVINPKSSVSWINHDVISKTALK